MQDVYNYDAIISTFKIIRDKAQLQKSTLEETLRDPSILDLAVRLMFMTGCQVPGAIGGDIFRPRWRSNESFGCYLRRVYPLSKPWTDDAQNQSISLNKLSANYLKGHANVDIRWTDHLTDPMLLLKGSDWKSVYVFAHPAFISVSLSMLRDHQHVSHQPDEDALRKCVL